MADYVRAQEVVPSGTPGRFLLFPIKQGLAPGCASSAHRAPGMGRKSGVAEVRLLRQHTAVQVVWTASMVWAV